jgi:hypothetical protein
MYNPFDAEIMKAVIANILDSVARSPRKVFVIYLNPLCRDVIEKQDAFDLVANYLFHRSRFVVYCNKETAKRGD